ncbi:substrate-binding domain-containing protein [Mesobacillus zeae]|uniref:Tungsten ABC transporter substrate-binding protein n=1 Tax=Mesobacillus zeae TaxID=1917180 RepID=A0A398B9R3_9BACI|nr:substrate-binding domain-containing protein [Mesobacillus zeae]RID86274.1 tungsten ABC transporter substrate-binding protein [Mesobacillus zeae]
MKKKLLSMMLIFMLAIITACSGAGTDSKEKAEKKVEKRTDLILATTTSTQDSGLLDVLVPQFEKKYPYKVKTIAVGTGQALEMGTRGEADVLLVHAPEAEQKIVDSGDAINRHKVMYNDFIIVGPSADPAGIKGVPAKEAFTKLMESNQPFVSRGDDSGTHKKELELWKNNKLDPAKKENYISTGQGMGSTLQVAAEKKGYTLTDRATYLAQKKSLGEFDIMSEGDDSLLNIYHVMQVNPEKHEKINKEGAKDFVHFMKDNETKKTISEFGKDKYGQALFFLFDK